MKNAGNKHLFQVDLRGVIDILANHLYSTPKVFVRELLQNGCDAIQMRRQQVEGKHRGRITVELILPKKGDRDGRPTLIFSDDGIGLTVDEVHKFLSTVGRSSKRDELFQSSGDFIGQFGIGLLSCFTVSEKITVITRTAREDRPACQWIAHADGTYEVTELEREMEPGTTVHLRARAGLDKMFSPDGIVELMKKWGLLLPFEVTFSCVEHGDGEPVTIALPGGRLAKLDGDKERALRFGEDLFPAEAPFLDAIPIRSEIGGVKGFAYVSGRASRHSQLQKHRVYLKGMLLAEENDAILPEWAFFVRAFVNAESLRPTASREDIYEDEILDEVRRNLGESLKNYLIELSRMNPDFLSRLISLHWLSFKALAVEDDDFFQIVINWLPFETTMGRMSLPQMLEAGKGEVKYARTSEEFRQIGSVAGAQGLCVVDSGYVYDRELLDRIRNLTPHAVSELDLREVIHTFEDLTEEEREGVGEFLRTADVTLQAMKCRAEVRKYEPGNMPVFFVANEAAGFLKSVEQSGEGKGDEMLGSILDTLSQDAREEAYASVCFNFHHPQIRRLLETGDQGVVKASVRMLYVQSLLLGQQAMSQSDLNLLTQGIGTFLDWGLSKGTGSPS